MVGKIVAALCLALPLATFAAGSDDSSSSSAQEEDSMWSRAKGLVDGGRFESALPVLFEVVGQEGERADAYNLLGFTHRKTGKLDAALKEVRRIWDTSRHPVLAADVHHGYGDKYCLSEYLTNAAMAVAHGPHVAA